MAKSQPVSMVLADNVRQSVQFATVLKKSDRVASISARYAEQVMFNPDAASRAAAITNLQGEIITHFDQKVIPAATQLGRQNALSVVRSIGSPPLDINNTADRQRILFAGQAKADDRLRIFQRLVNDKSNTLENRLGVYWLEPGRDSESKLEQLRRLHEQYERQREEYQARLDRFNQGEGRRPNPPRLDFLSKFTKETTQAVYETGRRVGTDAETTEFQSRGFDRFTWITVNAGEACPDCRKRQGTTGTLAYFDEIGRPGSGATVCGAACFCLLVPAETVYHAPDLARGLEVESKPVVSNPDDVQKIDDQKITPPAAAADKSDPVESVRRQIAADSESAETHANVKAIVERGRERLANLNAAHSQAASELQAAETEWRKARYDAPQTSQNSSITRQAQTRANTAANKYREATAARDREVDRQRAAAHKAIAIDPDERFDQIKGIAVVGDTPAVFRSAATRKAVVEAGEFIQSIVRRPGEYSKTLPAITFKVNELANGEKPYISTPNGGDNAAANTLGISPNSGVEAVTHLLGHELEARLPGAKKAAAAFLALRTAGEKPKGLAVAFPDDGFDSGEKFKDDDFGKVWPNSPRNAAYTGKIYASGATEIIAMGIQLMFSDPAGFALADGEYFRLMLGILGGRLIL